jgi:prephenate dehydratase
MIHQNLMALKGQTIEDIVEVHSHPMALLQCMDFKKYPK